MPEAAGIWDEVFSQLYKMVKQHNQTKQDWQPNCSISNKLPPRCRRAW